MLSLMMAHGEYSKQATDRYQDYQTIRIIIRIIGHYITVSTNYILKRPQFALRSNFFIKMCRSKDYSL